MSPVGADFSLRLPGETPPRRESFIFLDLLTFPFSFLYVLNYYFFPLRQAETITWENVAPAKRDRGSTTGTRLCRNETFQM